MNKRQKSDDRQHADQETGRLISPDPADGAIELTVRHDSEEPARLRLAAGELPSAHIFLKITRPSVRWTEDSSNRDFFPPPLPQRSARPARLLGTGRLGVSWASNPVRKEAGEAPCRSSISGGICPAWISPPAACPRPALLADQKHGVERGGARQARAFRCSSSLDAEPHSQPPS